MDVSWVWIIAAIGCAVGAWRLYVSLRFGSIISAEFGPAISRRENPVTYWVSVGVMVASLVALPFAVHWISKPVDAEPIWYTTRVSEDQKNLYIKGNNRVVSTISVYDIPSFDMTEGVPSIPEEVYRFTADPSDRSVDRGYVFFKVFNLANSGTGGTHGARFAYDLKTGAIFRLPPPGGIE